LSLLEISFLLGIWFVVQIQRHFDIMMMVYVLILFWNVGNNVIRECGEGIISICSFVVFLPVLKYTGWFNYFYSFFSVYCISAKIEKFFFFIWLNRALITLLNCIILIWFVLLKDQNLNKFRNPMKKNFCTFIFQCD